MPYTRGMPREAKVWKQAPASLEIGSGQIQVWRAVLDVGDARVAELERLLAPDEIDRADRFFAARDRNHFVAARGILRVLLGRYLDRTPNQLQFRYGSRGKPSLGAGFQDAEIQFNVSHAHGLALLAFARTRHLGVDLERIRPEIAAEEIATRYFSLAEIAELKAVEPTERAEAFFRCWTRKEAYIKARGEGLQIPLASFSVSLAAGRPERLDSEDAARWTLCAVEPGEAFAGALVGEGKDWEPQFFSWNHDSPLAPEQGN